jgi:hypothetical protein
VSVTVLVAVEFSVETLVTVARVTDEPMSAAPRMIAARTIAIAILL